MKPLSREELIAEAKRYRDTLSGQIPDSMMVSDKQIQQNVDKKYKTYLSCFKFSDRQNVNGDKFKEFAEKHGQKNYCDIRNVECQGIGEEQFEERLNEVNTPTKASNFKARTFERIIKGNYKELTEASLNPEKLADYLDNNGDFVNASMTAGGLLGLAKKGEISEKEYQLISKNTKLFENLGSEMKVLAQFNSSPLSMLFEGYSNPLNEKESFDVVQACITTGLNPVMKGDKTKDEWFQMDTISAIANAKVDDITIKFNKYLTEHNITDISIFKPEKEGQTLVDAMLNGDNLVRKSDEEIKEMNDNFHKFEKAVLQETLENKNATAEQKREAFVNFQKNAAPEEAKEAFIEYEKKVEGKTITEENFKEAYFDFNKQTVINENKKRLEKEQKERENAEKSIIDRAVKAKTEYEKQSGVAKFFSRLLPASWTKTGRMRQEMNSAMADVTFRGLDDRFEEAYREATQPQQAEVKGSEVTNEERTKKQEQPENTRRSIEITELASEINSSKENFEKEQGMENTMQESKTFDDFEIIEK